MKKNKDRIKIKIKGYCIYCICIVLALYRIQIQFSCSELIQKTHKIYKLSSKDIKVRDLLKSYARNEPKAEGACVVKNIRRVNGA